MKDPAALLYIDTWKQATTEMSAISRAYYMDLILHQYDKGSLPSNIEELANICRVRFSEFEQFKQVFEQVLKQKFKQNDSGRLENEFAKEIIRRREKFVKKRSEAGKLSYVLRYFRSNFKISKGLEDFIKKTIEIDFDIKDEQVLKQVFKHLSELYKNGDGDGDKNKDRVKNIVDYLNSVCEKDFKHSTKKTKEYISARIKEGFSESDFKKVIDIKAAEWKGTDMDQYLRPETLFSNKFESYLNQKSFKQISPQQSGLAIGQIHQQENYESQIKF